MNKAIFLDRDGVINEDAGHIKSVVDFHIISGVPAAIKALNNSGYYVIVITNQGALAKGLMTLEALHAIHNEMRVQLAKEGARIDKIYYCPHHVDGTVAEYAVECDCRKPNTKMIKDAIIDFGIDVNESFLVGDKLSDISAGHRMGLRTVLVGNTHDAKNVVYEVTPDLTAPDLASAIKYFL